MDPDQLEHREFEVAGQRLTIYQDTRGSGALRPLDDDRPGSSSGAEEGPPPIATGEQLARVGLAVWQAGFVLADLLLRRPPYGPWPGVRVLDLGCGTGLVGLLLALAGADVTLSDQPHIVPLAELNVSANCQPGLHQVRVVGYSWGQPGLEEALLSDVATSRGSEAAAAEPPPAGTPATSYDVITAADVVYQPEVYPALAATLRTLSAPHSLLYLSHKRRGLHEEQLVALLEGAGFAVREVPQAQLAEEYQEGSCYRVLCATRID